MIVNILLVNNNKDVACDKSKIFCPIASFNNFVKEDNQICRNYLKHILLFNILPVICFKHELMSKAA